jgi:hypothetical protein
VNEEQIGELMGLLRQSLDALADDLRLSRGAAA